MHPAWPSKDTATTQEQKLKHVYSTEVLKAIPLIATPTGHVVQQQEQRCSFSRVAPSHEDTTGEFSLDPDTFDAVMRAETAEVGRAHLSHKRLQSDDHAFVKK
jgi:hypothetical protein